MLLFAPTMEISSKKPGARTSATQTRIQFVTYGTQIKPCQGSPGVALCDHFSTHFDLPLLFQFGHENRGYSVPGRSMS